MGHVLIVDDERSIRVTLKAFLEEDGHQVETAEEAEAALAIIKDKPIDVVLTDIILPKLSGVQLLEQIRKISPDVLVIMMTGEPTLETASQSLRHEAVDYLQKPIGKAEIIKTTQNALRVKQLNDEKRRLEEENKKYLENLEDLVTERTRALAGSEAALRSQAQELAILNSLARAVGENMEVQATIQAGIQHILEAISPDLIVIFLLKNDEYNLAGQFSGEEMEMCESQAVHRVGECLCGLCISENQNIYSEDVRTDHRCMWRECKKAGVHSFVALALKSGTEILGVLGLASVKKRDFSKERHFLEALANELAIGLKKSLLYEQLEKRAEELEVSLNQIKASESERLQLQRQLQQSQKMEAIGTLAGGIAHDFNNILSGIIGFTELAFIEAEGYELLQQHLKEILNASSRAKDLIEQILAFSRQSDQIEKPICLKPITAEALKLLRASLPATIEIRESLNSQLTVLGDPSQIHQVFMNLCTNAAYAMREDGGVLDVSLADVQFDSQDNIPYPELSRGTYARLTVSDTGAGMTPYVLDRIFDPFFTTKKEGEGTGMGLAVVHGIVSSMNGIIKVQSTPEKGTTFQIYLPGLPGEEEKVRVAEQVNGTGSERVLFVDDEPMLANLGKTLLQPLGYKVTVRTCPVEAVEVFKSNPMDFDVVITDLTMPNMTGDKLASAILDIRPNMPIILCTGFSKSIEAKRAANAGVQVFLHKPYLRQDLAKAIRQAVAGT
jgi:signal transduction histidine kinase/YesN/AraC family two-component response regulator